MPMFAVPTDADEERHNSYGVVAFLHPFLTPVTLDPRIVRGYITFKNESKNKIELFCDLGRDTVCAVSSKGCEKDFMVLRIGQRRRNHRRGGPHHIHVGG